MNVPGNHRRITVDFTLPELSAIVEVVTAGCVDPPTDKRERRARESATRKLVDMLDHHRSTGNG